MAAVITQSKGLVAVENGSHGLECDVISLAHDRKDIQVTALACQFAQTAAGLKCIQGILSVKPCSMCLA